MKTYKMKFAFIFVTLFSVTIVSAQIPAPPQMQPVVLENGTIHTITGTAITNGSILFDNGKIMAVGENISFPDNAIKIDISGKHVYPGIIESASQLGLQEVGAVRATVDYAETGAINPNVKAEVAVNAESELFPVARANGITMAVTLPRGGIIAGKSALIKTDGWNWEEMTVQAPLSMIVNWPRMTVRRGSQNEKQQSDRIKEQIKMLHKAFDDAKAYVKAREAASEKGTFLHKYDARWEAMIPVFKKEIPVWISANTIKQINAAISLADEQDINIVILGGIEAEHVAEELKKRNIPVIITSILRLPDRRDAAFDEPFTLPLRLYEAGVKFCIACGELPMSGTYPIMPQKQLLMVYLNQWR